MNKTKHILELYHCKWRSVSSYEA